MVASCLTAVKKTHTYDPGTFGPIEAAIRAQNSDAAMEIREVILKDFQDLKKLCPEQVMEEFPITSKRLCRNLKVMKKILTKAQHQHNEPHPKLG